MTRDFALTASEKLKQPEIKVNIDRLKRVISRAVWPVTDQAASSLGNFVTNVFLARSLARENFGTFGLILEAIFFCNALQSALINYPLSVRGATCDRKDLSRYTTASLLLTFLLALPVIAVALVSGAVAHEFRIAMAASLALLLWQAQETVRRALLAHGRYRDAVIGDALSYIGQAVCIVTLSAIGRLSIAHVFLTIALTSAVAAMVQLAQVGLTHVSWREVMQRGRDFLGYGRYLAVYNLAVFFSTLGYSWSLAWAYGVGAVAELYAILALLKLTSPIINLVVNLIVPAAAKTHANDGPSAAGRVAAKYALLGSAALVPYCALLILAPSWFIKLFYGSSSVYVRDANVLRLYVACAALTYAASSISAFFNGISRSRLSMNAQLVNAGVSLLFGLPMVLVGGLPAAAAGSVLSLAAQLAVLLHFRSKIQLRLTRDGSQFSLPRFSQILRRAA